jgi:cytochrome b561
VGLRSTSSRYGAVAQASHWLTVVLVLAAYVLSKGDPYSLYSAAADGTRRIHETLGMLVLTVVVLRLLWRLIDGAPATEPIPGWMAAAAKLVQLTLYALLVAVPATAVLGTWLEGLPLTFPGFDVAPQIPQAHGLGQLIIEIHSTLVNVILWVGGVHVAAALFHHFYLCDGVLKSMAPGGQTPRLRKD